MRLAVGSDERTYLTDSVVAELEKRGHSVQLVGPLKGTRMEWPEVAFQVAECVRLGQADEGVLFCWTGTGVSMAANKVFGVRAALCQDAETARGARLWNRANVLCLSLRAISPIVAKEIMDAWFGTPLGEDPTDIACVERMEALESKYKKVANAEG